MAAQRRGAAIAMTRPELDAFLQAGPVCRLGTIGPGGQPHVSALWFVRDGTHIWLNSLLHSRRWTDLGRGPRSSAIADEGGLDFIRLRGVELRGRVEVVGETPRRGAPNDELRTPEWDFPKPRR